MNDDKRSPSVYDVASAAGVSTASVSRFFRSPEKLSDATRSRVAKSVDALGYLPSGNARGLTERRTGMIGLYSFSGHEPDELERAGQSTPGAVERVVERGRAPRLFPLFADEVLRGVELECTLRRLPLAVGWQDGDDGGVRLDDIARRCDGLIVLPATIDDDHLRRIARRMPVVLVSQPVPSEATAHSVTVDDEGGMRALAEHLADDHGVRDFWWAGPAEGAEHAARFRGFAEVLRERGVSVPDGPVVATGSRTGTRAAMLATFEEHPELRSALPQAIVCSSDQTALGVIAALTELGIDVPDRVAVTGFDGIDAGRFAEPSLTTVRQPMDELGREAVSILLEQIAERGLATAHDTTLVLPVSLVIRNSCGCA